MKQGLIPRIVQARSKASGKSITEKGLAVTLSKIKKRENLRSIEQAACFYILKQRLNINVSSVIDDVTRAAIASNRTQKPLPTRASANAAPKAVRRVARVAHKVKWLGDNYYSRGSALAEFYPYLFIYENALRLKVNSEMEKKYPNWWENKIKGELRDTYKYAADRKVEQARFPMVGKSRELKPFECITLGHLQGIIEKYQAVFVPSIFPSLHFFTGHMVIVLRVRHGMAHTSPAITAGDVRNAKHEMDILLQHLSTL